MKIFKNCLIAVACLMMTSTAYSQKVVLVNGEAKKVNIEDNAVTEIQKDVPNYMNGFEDTSADPYTKVEPRIGTQAVVASDRNMAEAKLSPFTTVKKDKTVSFGDGSSVLSTEAQDFIKKIAASVKSGEAKTVLLKSSHVSDDRENLSIMRKRVEACKKLLIENGVAPNLILTSMFSAKEATDVVGILLKK